MYYLKVKDHLLLFDELIQAINRLLIWLLLFVVIFDVRT